MTDTAPPEVQAAAMRLQAGCRCSWTAEDRDLVTVWLAERADAQPPGFPVRLSQRGTGWWLDKA